MKDFEKLISLGEGFQARGLHKAQKDIEKQNIEKNYKKGLKDSQVEHY